MSNDEKAIHGTSDGGMFGEHPSAPVLPVFVGPATGKESNTIRIWPKPILCWKVEDIRFAFDSSFISFNIDPSTNPSDPTSDPDARPFSSGDIRDELRMLATQIQKNPGCPLSVFGHADPVGPAVDPDGYNKALSGRRATAIYALLISGTEPDTAAGLWRKIASQENWGANQSQTMQQATGLPKGTSVSALISSYLPKLVPPEFAELQIGPSNFLAQGADSAGKGDYQGCSSFNPLIIFSQEKQDRFAPAATHPQSEAFTERNLANASNRRVLVLIFEKGSKVDPRKWPCPSATGDKSGCIKRFWSDGQKRRSTRLPADDRKFELTHDTFACRFYQRLTDRSPCERTFITFQIRLYTPAGLFIPLAPFRLTVGASPPRTGLATDQGIVVAKDVEVPNQCLVEWGYPPEAGEQPSFIFSTTMFLEPDEQKSEAEVTQKLHNLGYPEDGDFAANVTAFQRDYGDLVTPALIPNGQLDDNTLQLIRDVYRSCEDDLRTQKPQAGAAS